MSRARALFCPTKYIEPFGNVAVEAMACGTPVLCTDWGAFTETVVDWETGFRCRSFQEFMDRALDTCILDPKKIRSHVEERYTLDVVGRQYERYFERLQSLWGRGWYEEEKSDAYREDRSSPDERRQEDHGHAHH